MKLIISLFLIFFLLSCKEERLPDNTYSKRKATSEQEISKKGNIVLPGQVVSMQLEYINQDLKFCFGWDYDTGTSGVDEINLKIPEDYEFKYRLEQNGYEVNVRLINGSGAIVFELNQNNLQYTGNLTAGDYKLQIINPIEWISPDSNLIPVFIQPDHIYLSDFGNSVLTKNYLSRDVVQLISVGKCEYCDLQNAESGIMDYQYLKNVSFRASDLRNSDFSHSILTHSKFSSFIANETEQYMWGQTNLNNAKFRYCLLDSSDLSNTYDMNNADFYFSNFYRSIISNSIGRYVNFESCILSSSTFRNVAYNNSYFIGAVSDSCYADSSKFIDSDLTYAIFTNSSFNYTKFTGSRLDYARFDSVYMYGSDLCLISKINTNFDSLKVDANTLCNPNQKSTEEEEK